MKPNAASDANRNQSNLDPDSSVRLHVNAHTTNATLDIPAADHRGPCSCAPFQHAAGFGGVRHLVAIALTLLSCISSFAADAFKDRARQRFMQAKQRFETETNSVVAAWGFALAAFDWGEFAEGNRQREEIAEQGIAAAKRAVILDSKSAPAHLYLAMNLGQLARTKTIGALKLVKQMEKEFKLAIELDAKFDHACAERSLGLLYFEAPGWPTSIGSNKKARVHLERAVRTIPDYPENRLCLLEAYIQWEDQAAIERELKAIRELWPKAKKTLTGEAWEQNWIDWERRWEQAKERSARILSR